jgi:SAM-dependent methyltransferase
VGFEPSSSTYQKASPEIKPHIINGPFSEDAISPGSVDLITCFQTLAHLPNPGETLARFAGLLRPGGLVMVVAHNFASLGVGLLGARHPIGNAGHLTFVS